MGGEARVPAKSNLFGLYVDGLEKHLLDMTDIDAPTLIGVMVLSLLYADDLILMSESAAGLQKQLDALASFCEERRLTVNLSKTKVMVFEHRQSQVSDFVLNGAVVERVESYKYLGFVLHATKALTFGTSFLVAAARKAMFAMRRRCALLGIRDPALQCKLFDILVLPILSYACEVWAMNASVGEAAEVLHRSFLKHLLGVRMCTANEIVFAEVGRFPLQIHFWQQILHYHHRVIALDNSRLVKLTLVDGCALGTHQSVLAAANKGWQYYVGLLLEQHSQQLFHSFDIASVVEREKHWVAFKYLHTDSHSSLVLYRTLQHEYQYACYLSEVKCYSNRRLMSRFRSGCHGLRVDTGRWDNNVHLDRKDRLCQVCGSAQQVEDEHHFLFDCPVYTSIRAGHASLFQHACSVSDFFAKCEANTCGGFIRRCFSLRSSILTI